MKIKILLFVIIFALCSFAMPLVALADDDETNYSEASEPADKDVSKKISLDSSLNYTDTEVLVRYSKSYSMSSINSALKAEGSSLDNELEGSKWVAVKVPKGQNVEGFMKKLAKNKHVEAVQPNYLHELEATSVNDPYANLSNPDQWHLDKIGAFDAWDTTMGSSTVRVAVLDTGIDLSHADLVNQIYAQTDVVDNDGSAQDDHGHGTHVCGTIAAEANNGLGGAGVAPGAKLIAVDVFHVDEGEWLASDTDIVEGINYAITNGADVISMSLGSYGASQAESDAIDNAIANGIVVVAAAGNDSIRTLHYPSDFPGVISVISTGESDAISSFSNYGQTKDISAPGEYIYATKKGGGYCYMSGTSMATPVVSGVVALLLSAQPGLTVDEVKNILYNTSVDLGDPGRDDYFGHGRVDAAAAVVGSVDPNQQINDPIFTAGDYICVDHGDGTCSIKEYTGSTANLTIPDTMNGLVVDGIDYQAFYCGYQYQVTIPDTVEYIEEDAFYWNELTTLNLPDGLEYIGIRAFAANDFDNVVIPEGVLEIDNFAFCNNADLEGYGEYADIETVALPASLTRLGNSVFAGCDKLTSMTISTGVTTIGAEAFYDCSALSEVNMPTSVTEIGDNAFTNCHEDLVFYGTLGSYAQSYAAANGIPFTINFDHYEDTVGSTVMCRTYFNTGDDEVCKEYFRGLTDEYARIQADYFNMAGTMVFTEIYNEADTIIASVWFQNDGVTKQFKNYYNTGQLYFQEEYDETDTIIASIWFQDDGVNRHFKNYYSGGVLYFQEEYDTNGIIIASIWFQADGITRHFKNYYVDGYLYFQEECNTSGTMIASIDFRADGTRERKCYYRTSDGSLYLIEYYDEDESCTNTEWF